MFFTNDFKADLARYPSKRPFLKEQSLWAVAVYRYGRWTDIKKRPLSFFHRIVYLLLFRLTETITGIGLPKDAMIGPGLRIWHFGGIFVHNQAVIGSNCTLRQGVTIGNRVEGGLVPVIGNNVDIGAYAQILGGVRIGNNCKIGAMAVVLTDVPDNCTAVGAPARIIQNVSHPLAE